MELMVWWDLFCWRWWSCPCLGCFWYCSSPEAGCVAQQINFLFMFFIREGTGPEVMLCLPVFKTVSEHRTTKVAYMQNKSVNWQGEQQDNRVTAANVLSGDRSNIVNLIVKLVLSQLKHISRLNRHRQMFRVTYIWHKQNLIVAWVGLA